MGELDGIILPTGEQVYSGLTNSFRRGGDSKKNKYLSIAIGVILLIELIAYLTRQLAGRSARNTFFLGFNRSW
jgi:hypothetical protein